MKGNPDLKSSRADETSVLKFIYRKVLVDYHRRCIDWRKKKKKKEKKSERNADFVTSDERIEEERQIAVIVSEREERYVA